MRRKSDGIPSKSPVAKKRFASRLNYLLEVGSFALTVLFPFAAFFLPFFLSFVASNPTHLRISKRFELGVSLHMTNNSCRCRTTLRIFDEFLNQRLGGRRSFSGNCNSTLFYASKRVREEAQNFTREMKLNNLKWRSGKDRF